MGSHEQYESDGKSRSRLRWHEESTALAVSLGRPLKAFWLSNNEFSDLVSVSGLFSRVFVPENNATNYPAKKRTLEALGTTPIRISDRPMEAFEYLQELRAYDPDLTFDVVNLDYCIHFSAGVEHTLGYLIRSGLVRHDTLLFMTVSTISAANKNPLLHNKNIARGLLRVNELAVEELSREQASTTSLAAFPFRYKNRNASLLSFGWKVKKLQQPSPLSAREKAAIRQFRSSDVPLAVIANAFSVPTHAVISA